jgi:hypothetical protein
MSVLSNVARCSLAETDHFSQVLTAAFIRSTDGDSKQLWNVATSRVCVEKHMLTVTATKFQASKARNDFASPHRAGLS